MNRKLFSIAIVSYNQRNLIEDCINSILEQTYENIELILCDDNSCDFDVKEIENYIEKNKNKNIKNVIVYKQNRNVGTSANCQKAMELASGEYFKLQAGDDMLREPDVLKKIANLLELNSCNVIIGRAQACTHEGTLVNDIYPLEDNFSKAKNASPRKLFELLSTRSWGAYVCAPAVFWRMSFLKEMGGFDLSYKYTEDWPLWLEICKRGYEITYTDMITTIYRYGGISNGSSELNKSIGKEHYQECIRMLKEKSMPVLKEKYSRLVQMRCWFSIKSIEARIVQEQKWSYWTLLRKIIWRIQNIPFLLMQELFYIRYVGLRFDRKKPILFLILLSFISYWNDLFYQNENGNMLFLILFWMTFFYLIGSILASFLIKIVKFLCIVRIKYFK